MWQYLSNTCCHAICFAPNKSNLKSSRWDHSQLHRQYIDMLSVMSCYNDIDIIYTTNSCVFCIQSKASAAVHWDWLVDVGKVMVETFKAWHYPWLSRRFGFAPAIESVFSDWITQISQIPLSDTAQHVTHVATVQVFAQGSKTVGVKCWFLQDHFFCYTTMGILAEKFVPSNLLKKSGNNIGLTLAMNIAHRTC